MMIERLISAAYAVVAPDVTDVDCVPVPRAAIKRLHEAITEQRATSIDTITTNTAIALIDEVTRSLAAVPGRTPQDKGIGYTLLKVVEWKLADVPGSQMHELLLGTGVDSVEADAIATALEALALRIGAWLGRETR